MMAQLAQCCSAARRCVRCVLALRRAPAPPDIALFSKLVVGTAGKSNTVNLKHGRIFQPGHVEDLGNY